ncbi:MAG: hypothetical protein K0S44_2848 [Bacteroidetes bacterium]|jgi:hypothetical protein|nr:hypothetical protein [Bacteroidota bacterium]
MDKNKKIEDVLNSLEGIKSTEANPFLYNRILSKIQASGKEYTPAKIIWLAAASFLLLLFLNISAIRKAMINKNGAVYQSENTVSGYNLINENPIQYN